MCRSFLEYPLEKFNVLNLSIKRFNIEIKT